MQHSQLDEALIEALRQHLMARQDDLLGRHREVVLELTATERARGDDLDLASEEQARTEQTRSSDRERAALWPIQQALARLDDGSYGICALCEDEIPVGRLRALPETTTCVDCKQHQEQRDRRPTGRPGMLEAFDID